MKMQMATSIETENGDMIVKRVSVPVGLEELMEGLTKEVMLKKPKDVYVFASEYFAKLLDLRDKGQLKGKNTKRAQSVSRQQFSLMDNGQKYRNKSKSVETAKQLSRQANLRSNSPIGDETFSTKKIQIGVKTRHYSMDKRKMGHSHEAIVDLNNEQNAENSNKSQLRRERSLSNHSRMRSNSSKIPSRQSTTRSAKIEKENFTTKTTKKAGKILLKKNADLVKQISRDTVESNDSKKSEKSQGNPEKTHTAEEILTDIPGPETEETLMNSTESNIGIDETDSIKEEDQIESTENTKTDVEEESQLKYLLKNEEQTTEKGKAVLQKTESHSKDSEHGLKEIEENITTAGERRNGEDQSKLEVNEAKSEEALVENLKKSDPIDTNLNNPEETAVVENEAKFEDPKTEILGEVVKQQSEISVHDTEENKVLSLSEKEPEEIILDTLQNTNKLETDKQESASSLHVEKETENQIKEEDKSSAINDKLESVKKTDHFETVVKQETVKEDNQLKSGIDQLKPPLDTPLKDIETTTTSSHSVEVKEELNSQHLENEEKHLELINANDEVTHKIQPASMSDKHPDLDKKQGAEEAKHNKENLDSTESENQRQPAKNEGDVKQTGIELDKSLDQTQKPVEKVDGIKSDSAEKTSLVEAQNISSTVQESRNEIKETEAGKPTTDSVQSPDKTVKDHVKVEKLDSAVSEPGNKIEETRTTETTDSVQHKKSEDQIGTVELESTSIEEGNAKEKSREITKEEKLANIQPELVKTKPENQREFELDKAENKENQIDTIQANSPGNKNEELPSKANESKIQSLNQIKGREEIHETKSDPTKKITNEESKETSSVSDSKLSESQQVMNQTKGITKTEDLDKSKEEETTKPISGSEDKVQEIQQIQEDDKMNQEEPDIDIAKTEITSASLVKEFKNEEPVQVAKNFVDKDDNELNFDDLDSVQDLDIIGKDTKREKATDLIDTGRKIISGVNVTETAKKLREKSDSDSKTLEKVAEAELNKSKQSQSLELRSPPKKPQSTEKDTSKPQPQKNNKPEEKCKSTETDEETNIMPESEEAKIAVSESSKEKDLDKKPKEDSKVKAIQAVAPRVVEHKKDDAVKLKPKKAKSLSEENKKPRTPRVKSMEHVLGNVETQKTIREENQNKSRTKRAISVDAHKKSAKLIESALSFDSLKLRKEKEKLKTTPVSKLSKTGMSIVAAALKIQSVWRGFVVRKHLKTSQSTRISDTCSTTEINTDKIINRDDPKIGDENAAATAIEINDDNKDKSKQRSGNEDLKIARAVLKIQAIWRGFHVRQRKKRGLLFGLPVDKDETPREELERREEHSAAIKIQSIWKGYKARESLKLKTMPRTNQLPADLIFKAASIIQAGVRGYMTRRKYRTSDVHLRSIKEETGDEEIIAALKNLQEIPRYSPITALERETKEAVRIISENNNSEELEDKNLREEKPRITEGKYANNLFESEPRNVIDEVVSSRDTLNTSQNYDTHALEDDAEIKSKVEQQIDSSGENKHIEETKESQKVTEDSNMKSYEKCRNKSSESSTSFDSVETVIFNDKSEAKSNEKRELSTENESESNIKNAQDLKEPETLEMSQTSRMEDTKQIDSLQKEHNFEDLNVQGKKIDMIQGNNEASDSTSGQSKDHQIEALEKSEDPIVVELVPNEVPQNEVSKAPVDYNKLNKLSLDKEIAMKDRNLKHIMKSKSENELKKIGSTNEKSQDNKKNLLKSLTQNALQITKVSEQNKSSKDFSKTPQANGPEETHLEKENRNQNARLQSDIISKKTVGELKSEESENKKKTEEKDNLTSKGDPNSAALRDSIGNTPKEYKGMAVENQNQNAKPEPQKLKSEEDENKKKTEAKGKLTSNAETKSAAKRVSIEKTPREHKQMAVENQNAKPQLQNHKSEEDENKKEIEEKDNLTSKEDQKSAALRDPIVKIPKENKEIAVENQNQNAKPEPPKPNSEEDEYKKKTEAKDKLTSKRDQDSVASRVSIGKTPKEHKEMAVENQNQNAKPQLQNHESEESENKKKPEAKDKLTSKGYENAAPRDPIVIKPKENKEIAVENQKEDAIKPEPPKHKSEEDQNKRKTEARGKLTSKADQNSAALRDSIEETPERNKEIAVENQNQNAKPQLQKHESEESENKKKPEEKDDLTSKGNQKPAALRDPIVKIPKENKEITDENQKERAKPEPPKHKSEEDQNKKKTQEKDNLTSKKDKKSAALRDSIEKTPKEPKEMAFENQNQNAKPQLQNHESEESENKKKPEAKDKLTSKGNENAAPRVKKPKENKEIAVENQNQNAKPEPPKHKSEEDENKKKTEAKGKLTSKGDKKSAAKRDSIEKTPKENKETVFGNQNQNAKQQLQKHKSEEDENKKKTEEKDNPTSKGYENAAALGASNEKIPLIADSTTESSNQLQKETEPENLESTAKTSAEVLVKESIANALRESEKNMGQPNITPEIGWLESPPKEITEAVQKDQDTKLSPENHSLEPLDRERNPLVQSENSGLTKEHGEHIGKLQSSQNEPENIGNSASYDQLNKESLKNEIETRISSASKVQHKTTHTKGTETDTQPNNLVISALKTTDKHNQLNKSELVREIKIHNQVDENWIKREDILPLKNQATGTDEAGSIEEIDENEEVSGSLVHSSEFHDAITVTLSKDSSTQCDSSRERQRSLLHSGELHDMVMPALVEVEEETPGAGPLLTSCVAAQASIQDASACGPQPGIALPATKTSMETAKPRNNASATLCTQNKKSMEVEAATKIQAGFRGYQVRKQLKNKISSSPGGVQNQRKSARRKSSGRVADASRITAQNKKKNPSDLEEKSAVKIQAGVRGFLVRRRQKKQIPKQEDES